MCSRRGYKDKQRKTKRRKERKRERNKISATISLNQPTHTGTEYPTCSQKDPSDPNDDFEGECKFHENIMTQDCGTQFTWFKKALAAVPSSDW